MKRFYREQFTKENLFSFNIIEKESDIFIVSDANIYKHAKEELTRLRKDIEEYIKKHPQFYTSLKPLTIFPKAPPIVKDMAFASNLYHVGPMASVAGAISKFLGQKLSKMCKYLVIENGGDIFIKSEEKIRISIYAGKNSPFTGKLTIEIPPQPKGVGICTSSGTVGHSLSFGKSDAVVAISSSPTISDAAATSIANKIKSPADIKNTLEEEKKRGILKGVVILIKNKAGFWGDLRIV